MANFSGQQQYGHFATQAEQKYGLPAGLLHGLIQQESGWNTQARSPSGAMGLTQLMPGTASGLGVRNPYDPQQSIEGGAKYLSQQYKSFGDWDKALAAYNAGPGAVSKYGGIPPYHETQDYVRKVKGYWGGAGATPVNLGDNSGFAGASSAHLPGDSLQATRIAQAYWNNPSMASILISKLPSMPSEVSQSSSKGFGDIGQGVAPKQSFRGLEGFQSKWGLRFDNPTANPFDNPQLGGGTHAVGSLHGKGQAEDFGTAKNPVSKLNQVAAYAFANPGQFKEFFWNPSGKYIKDGRIYQGSVPGHDDHIHVALN